MELPDDTPRLPKLPFIVGDLILLSVAAMLAFRMGSDPSTAEIVGIVVAAGLAVAVGLAPFIIGYARQQEIQLRERERMVEKLVRSTASAADQASIAAHGLHEIAEKTKANLDSMDNLPATIAAARKAAESQTAKADDKTLPLLREELAAMKQEMVAQNDALATRLDTAIAALSNSLQANAAAATASELATKPEPAEKPTKRAPRRKKSDAATLSENEDLLFGGEIVPLESPPEIETAVPPEPVAPQRKRKTKKTAPVETVEDEESSAATATPPAVEPPAPPQPDPVEPESVSAGEAAKPRPTTTPPFAEDESSVPASSVVDEPPAPAEPVVDESAATTAAPDEEPVQALSEDEPTAEAINDAQDDEVLDEPAPNEPALSSDGMTRLTVTAYIGIGNRLFIRGEGPGLSRDEGIPLQFVSIGKWRWETDAASDPVKITLWKNDEEACTSAGEITLQAGAQLETSANF